MDPTVVHKLEESQRKDERERQHRHCAGRKARRISREGRKGGRMVSSRKEETRSHRSSRARRRRAGLLTEGTSARLDLDILHRLRDCQESVGQGRPGRRRPRLNTRETATDLAERIDRREETSIAREPRRQSRTPSLANGLKRAHRPMSSRRGSEKQRS